MEYFMTDLSKVTTYPLEERSNKMEMPRDAAGAVAAGMTVADLLAAMPAQLGAAALNGHRCRCCRPGKG